MAVAAKHPEVSSRRSCFLVSAAQLLTSSLYCHGGMHNQSEFIDTKEGYAVLLGCEEETA